MISLSPSNDSAVLWFECQPGHFHLVDETPNCRSAAADTKVFQQWTKSEDLQKEKNRSLPASFGGRGGAVIYGFMEGAPKRRAARATGTTHLTHTMNYYMQWSLAGLLPLKEIKTKQTADSIVSSNTTDAPRKISSDSWTGVETVYSRRKWADGSWLEPHVCSLLLPFL